MVLYPIVKWTSASFNFIHCPFLLIKVVVKVYFKLK